MEVCLSVLRLNINLFNIVHKASHEAVRDWSLITGGGATTGGGGGKFYSYKKGGRKKF